MEELTILDPADIRMIGILQKVNVEGFPEGFDIPTPREMLLEYLRENADKGVDILLRIHMPCGRYVDYRTEDDIPHESVPCACGDPNHWFIKYEIIDNRES